MKSKTFLIQNSLLAWYGEHRRILPWRETSDPYRVWISEIMLQQTQVETVIPYYHRFLQRFPTVAALAGASADEVLKTWENLGYYARARHLHRAARIVVEKYQGVFPDTWEAITGLPGIGRYTAGAILSIAFGQPFPAVDGNVRRVMSRFYAIGEPVSAPATHTTLASLAAAIVPKKSPGLFNQALMDLGAMICTPRSPACKDCPLSRLCSARKQGLQDHLPVSEKKPVTPHERVTAAFIFNPQRQMLVVQRPARGLLASLWKLPGGIVRREETLEEGLARIVREELGIRIRVGEQVVSVKHAYTHFRITLYAFRCTRRNGRPRALACQEWRWASPHDLEALACSRADRTVIAAMQRQSVPRGISSFKPA
jgi:A/G-specific adenine glycosylase